MMYKCLMIISILLGLTACSFETIPPATKGKIMTTSGYSAEILPPGKHTLWGRDTLITLETATGVAKESMKVIMQDKLTLTFDIRFQMRLRDSNEELNAMFDDIVPVGNHISLAKVYRVYGEMIIRNKGRSVINKYTVEDVHRNYDRISKELAAAIEPAMKNTPLRMTNVTLANIKYPKVITEAVETAKGRELEIAKAQADAEIEMVQKENERRLADADYEVKIIVAKAIRDANIIIAEGVTPDLIEFRRLEVLERIGIAAAESGSATFIPLEGMTSVGSSVRMFGGS